MISWYFSVRPGCSTSTITWTMSSDNGVVRSGRTALIGRSLPPNQRSVGRTSGSVVTSLSVSSSGSITRDSPHFAVVARLYQLEPVETVTGEGQQVREFPDRGELDTSCELQRRVVAVLGEVQLDGLREA